jgi:DNA replicative helicase MCM subunit Mcm2 (Cdc46/Mcm family)
MDAQHLIDLLFGICGVLVGAVLRTMWADLKAQTATIAALNEKLGREYVRRDDYRDDITEMKGMLSRIFDKLDEKADKP